MTDPSFDVSIIVPVYNGGAEVRECIAALQATSRGVRTEIIVVDDGSTDSTAKVVKGLGVKVISLDRNYGQSVARNRGAQCARAPLLLFVDADVVLAPEAVTKVVAFMNDNPQYAALFGSYDDQPRSPTIVSQYRNLLHHFTHQQGDQEASTFWSGCGAVRTSVFRDIGGFDEGPYDAKMEDVELGYRLREAGHRIRLEPGIQGTHLKRWTLTSMIKTDVQLRAIPWARLIIERGEFPDTLNVRRSQRYSALLSGVSTAALLTSPFQPWFIVVFLVATTAMVLINRELFAFLANCRGFWFALGCIPLHTLYLFYSGLAFAFVWLRSRIRFAARGSV